MTTLTYRLAASAAALALATACSRGGRSFDEALKIEPLSLSAPADSAMPQLTVSGDRAILSWVETGPTGESTLKFAERTGSGWAEPQTVASGSAWFLSAADVPSVMRLDEGTLAAHWFTESDASIEAYDVRLAFSKDDGRTWAAPISPHHDATKTQHGFVSLFPMPGSGLGAAWLDGRQMALEADKGNDNMSVRFAAFGRDGTQMSEVVVDARVCECCPMAVAITSGGPILAYRDRSPGEIRDIAVSRFVNGAWTEGHPAHEDGWEIHGCPVNGPAIAARGPSVAVAWFTAKNEQGHAFVAFSPDAGATFGTPVRLDDVRSLGRVAIALLDDGSAVAASIEPADGRAELRVRRVDGSGRRAAAQTVAVVAGRGGGYPRLVRRGQELLLAWTESRSTIRTAVVKLTP